MTAINTEVCVGNNTNIFQDQREFMQGAGQTIDSNNINQSDMYVGLIEEENEEFIEADNAHDTCISDEFLLTRKAETLKEAFDNIVVNLGWIQSHGINPEDVWNVCHPNNMAKLGDSMTKDPTTGKVNKSPESISRKAEMMQELVKLAKNTNPYTGKG